MRQYIFPDKIVITLYAIADIFTCLLVKSSPMAQVGPLREHPLRVAPRLHLDWIARAFLIRRGATGQLSAFCRPPENSRILQSFSFHWVSGSNCQSHVN
jgi:hypothetical protein